MKQAACQNDYQPEKLIESDLNKTIKVKAKAKAKRIRKRFNISIPSQILHRAFLKS